MTNAVEYLLDIPHEEYRHMEGVSSHGLGLARVSLRKYRYDLDHIEDWEDKESYKVGRAIHTIVLENPTFEQKYVLLPHNAKKPSWNKQKGFTAEEELYLAYQDVAKEQNKELLTHPQAVLITELHETVAQDPDVQNLLYGADNEVVVRWDENGIWCKARPDSVNKNLKVLLDLKSTTSAAYEDFQKTIFNYGYLYQMAWYRRALRAAGITIDECIILAIEKEKPYDYAIYRLHLDDLFWADRANMKLLEKIRQAKTTNFYPGYPKGVQNIRVSDWARDILEGDQND